MKRSFKVFVNTVYQPSSKIKVKTAEMKTAERMAFIKLPLSTSTEIE